MLAYQEMLTGNRVLSPSGCLKTKYTTEGTTRDAKPNRYYTRVRGRISAAQGRPGARIRADFVGVARGHAHTHTHTHMHTHTHTHLANHPHRV